MLVVVYPENMSTYLLKLIYVEIRMYIVKDEDIV